MAPSAIENYAETYEPTILKSSIFEENTKNYGYHHDATKNGDAVVHAALNNHISSIDVGACEAGEEEAFFVADMGEVYRQHLRWKMNLQRVKPHYGKLLNPDFIAPKLY